MVSLQGCYFQTSGLAYDNLEECPPKPSPDHSIDVDSKPLVPMSLEYKNWVTLKKYLDWLCSNSTVM